MTTIIGRLTVNGKLSMYGDTMISGGYNVKANADKVHRLHDALVSTAGDFIDPVYFKELYEIYTAENERISSKTGAIMFYKYIVDITGSTDLVMMVMTKDFQIIIDKGAIENMQIKGSEGILIMGSGHMVGLSLFHYNRLVSTEDIYNITSKLDAKTSKEFTSLTLD